VSSRTRSTAYGPRRSASWWPLTSAFFWAVSRARRPLLSMKPRLRRSITSRIGLVASAARIACSSSGTVARSSSPWSVRTIRPGSGFLYAELTGPGSIRGQTHRALRCWHRIVDPSALGYAMGREPTFRFRSCPVDQNRCSLPTCEGARAVPTYHRGNPATTGVLPTRASPRRPQRPTCARASARSVAHSRRVRPYLRSVLPGADLTGPNHAPL
jgi:hypothetical protein